MLKSLTRQLRVRPLFRAQEPAPAVPSAVPEPLPPIKGIRRIDPEHEIDVASMACIREVLGNDRQNRAPQTGSPAPAVATDDSGIEGVAAIKQALAGIPATGMPPGSDSHPEHREIMETLSGHTLQLDAIRMLFADGITSVLCFGAHERHPELLVLRYSTPGRTKECYVCPECLAALAWHFEARANGAFEQDFTCTACGHALKSPLFLSESRTLNFQGVFGPDGARLGASLAELNSALAVMNELMFAQQQQTLAD